MATTEPIRDKKHIREMAAYYLKQGKIRNYLLIILGVHTGLRISDLLRLRRGDVYDYEQDCFHTHIHLTERKTSKPKMIALNKAVLSALALCFNAQNATADDYLFQSRCKAHHPRPTHQGESGQIQRKCLQRRTSAQCSRGHWSHRACRSFCSFLIYVLFLILWFSLFFFSFFVFVIYWLKL